MSPRTSLVCLLSFVLIGCEGANPSLSEAQSRTLTSASQAPTGLVPAQSVSASRRTAITTAVERVAPAVVTVQTETVERVPVDFFESFMGGRSGERRNAGIGSGFVVRADGVIVTNAHVVAGATRVSVAMRDGTTYDATVVGVDESNDLAVVRIKAKELPVAPIGRSSDLIVGEWSIAIGNPFGFVLGNNEPSVSVGVVSAVGRNLAGRSEAGGAYIDMIQTDAAINPGNSGGPLVNASGEVIGVNSSIYSPSGGSVGLGFAIPIDRTKRIVEDLLEHGAVRQPWVGIRLQTPQADNARDAAKAVALVARVVPGSPAERAGVKVGDQVVGAGTRAVRNPFDWEARLLDIRVGETLPITVRRGGRDVRLSLQVTDAPEVTAQKVTVLRELQLITLTDAIRQERGVASSAGALVYRISERIRDEIGLQDGDVITQVGQSRVSSAEAASAAIDRNGARGPVFLVFERNRQLYQTSFYLR
ncbi:trypsin-like peptidase domain-containing protein [Gemmatimonas sp.]|uniref:trypsin-like peptidase domain-containing protein n=1 Tax=Gemmatimonas sp. TaxID=1962908 RepID=UPI0027B97D9E|nr:trypsin-like peptidase domain-containing protein [Gemmatimonas sp.]